LSGSSVNSWVLEASLSCARNFLFSTMPSEPAILGQVHSSPNSLSNVSRGFDRNRAVFRLFVCVDAQNKSQRLEGPKEPCPGPPKQQGPLPHATCSKTAPLSVSKMLRCFYPQSACVSLPGPVRRWTELYAHLQCHFALV
jgi:hypothetical protein